ncbi:MAG: cation:proton antiporter [Alphaproteobacteria bacterium]|nr:cation:proton antiporter [Alphaproteobacteria bacterium]
MEIHFVFLVLGGLLLIGVLADEIGRRTRLPRVSLMIVFGVAAGPSGFDLLPAAFQDWYEFLASAALTMVAFLLGGRLSVATLRRQGREILTVSATAVILTALVVGLGLLALGTPVVIALLLAGIATATAPAATQDVVKQLRARGPFTDTLLGVVAIDDAWGLIAFSLLLLVAKAIIGDGGIEILQQGLWEIGGAFGIGAAVGLPAAFLTGRLRDGEPIQAEALGVVFLCAGLAIWLEVSFLLAGMVAGALVVNLARHHRRPFHEIENVEWPFMVLFFVLAGASLEIGVLREIGLIGVAYLILRTIGRVLGGWSGSVMAGAPALHRRWIGFALIPQAGVALGMALVAANHFPDLGKTLLAATVSTTIVFELFGPLLTQAALRNAGEADQKADT